MNIDEYNHSIKRIANLYAEKNKLIGSMRGWCGSLCCVNAQKCLDASLAKDEEIIKAIDDMHKKVSKILPSGERGSIIAEALRDQKVKLDLSKTQKKDG